MNNDNETKNLLRAILSAVLDIKTEKQHDDIGLNKSLNDDDNLALLVGKIWMAGDQGIHKDVLIRRTPELNEISRNTFLNRLVITGQVSRNRDDYRYTWNG